MEELIGGTLRIISSFFIEVFLQIICWGIGWLTLKIFTLGIYPKTDTKEESIIFVGLSVLVALAIGLTFYVYLMPSNVNKIGI